MTKILDGRAVAKQLNEETRATISELEHINITPTLAIMRADENPSSIQYEKSATRFMDKLGIQTKHVTFPEGISQEELLQELEKLNKDKYLDYLKQNSFYVKDLNRNPSTYNTFKEQIKTKYHLRVSDKVENVLNDIETVTEVMKVIK